MFHILEVHLRAGRLQFLKQLGDQIGEESDLRAFRAALERILLFIAGNEKLPQIDQQGALPGLSFQLLLLEVHIFQMILFHHEKIEGRAFLQ